MHRLRQYFVTGLLVWLPAAITAWVLLWLMGILNGIFLSVLGALEAVILVTVIIFGTGVFVANMVGQWWLRRWDALMTRIPVVRSIYSSVKQVSDTLFSGSGQAFSKAVLVQFPHQGAWTVAFLTGRPGGEVAAHLAARGLGDELVSVYVPPTPTPTAGYCLLARRADVVDLAMSVDEALKYVISMGVVAPPARAQSAPAVPAISNPVSHSGK